MEVSEPKPSENEAAKPDTLLAFFKRSALPIKLRLGGLVLLAICVVSFSLTTITLLLFHKPKKQTVAHHGASRHTAAEEVSEEEVESDESFKLPYEMTNLSIGLTDATKTYSAYSQFTLVFDCVDEAALKWMKLNRARLLSLLYEVSNSFAIEDFNSPTGYAAFKDAIKKNIEVQYHGHPIRQIVIKDWLLN